MKTLIDKYNQGESVITVYLVNTYTDDGITYEDREIYRDGNWCQTSTVEA